METIIGNTYFLGNLHHFDVYNNILIILKYVCYFHGRGHKSGSTSGPKTLATPLDDYSPQISQKLSPSNRPQAAVRLRTVNILSQHVIATV